MEENLEFVKPLFRDLILSNQKSSPLERQSEHYLMFQPLEEEGGEEEVEAAGDHHDVEVVGHGDSVELDNVEEEDLSMALVLMGI